MCKIKKMSKKVIKEITAKLHNGYWICFDCAHKYGAKATSGNTCSTQECTLCEEDVVCNAITDWHWPKEFKIGYIWD